MTTTVDSGRVVSRDPARVLWLLTAASWLVVLVLLVTGTDRVASHDVVLEQEQWPWALRIGAFVAAWLVMLGAMMLPTTVPMARLFTRLVARRGGGRAALPAFYAGYLTIWTGFAVAALTMDTGIHLTVDHWSWLQRHTGLILGTTLVLAGGYQLSPLKDACLRRCRSPFGMLTQHYRPGPAGGWRVGVRHAASCVGCCWAWMLGLTAVMTAEKTTRRGARLVVPVGVAMIGAGAVLCGSTLV
jgi:predicted metal-binding membrane protein